MDFDAKRVPGAIVRCLRVGQRRDRIIFVVDEHFVAIKVHREGDPIDAPGLVVAVVPLPPWEQTYAP